MNFACGYSGGNTAVNHGVQEILHLLPGCVVAQNHMTMGIDQAGTKRPATGVDHACTVRGCQ